jgi:hypothetical protein
VTVENAVFLATTPVAADDLFIHGFSMSVTSIIASLLSEQASATELQLGDTHQGSEERSARP